MYRDILSCSFYRALIAKNSCFPSIEIRSLTKTETDETWENNMRECSTRPETGDLAPELSLTTETGAPFVLSKVKGHPTLLSFLSHAA
jgi:hypothetical protein